MSYQYQFIPTIVVLMIVIVGTGLQVEQFRSLLCSPLTLAGGTLSQVLLLPTGAFIIIVLMGPVPELAAGLLLVAAYPGGALSNFYCHLGRLNVPLTVMLTAISSILSFAVLPFVLAVTYPATASSWEVAVPVRELSLQLCLFLLLPIGIGMMLRYYFPHLAERHAYLLRFTSLTLLAMLLMLIMVDQWETVWRLSFDAAVMAILFTRFAALAGWGTGLVLRLELIDRYVFSVEFAIRNIGAAALVATSSMARRNS
jgi:BASS family bile acid:Na+ symporter